MSLKLDVKENAQELRVLYAEDEEDTREQMEQIFKLFFKEVIVAKNGQEAFELFQSNSIDLLITDLTMPKMNGIELIKKIKKINTFIHVIVLTAHNSSEDLMETIDLQIDGFLLKPIKMEKMLELFYKVTFTINLEKKSRDVHEES